MAGQGQDFWLVPFRANMAMSYSPSGELAEVLQRLSPSDLTRLLSVPVSRRKNRIPPPGTKGGRSTASVALNGPVKNEIPDNDKRVVKRSSDNTVQAEPSRYKKHVTTQLQRASGKQAPRAAANLYSLPVELHAHIFSFVDDIVDVVALGMTNQRFWPIALDFVEAHYMKPFGRWAGTSMVCLGGKVEPKDCPDLFSAKDLENLSKNQPKTASEALPTFRALRRGSARGPRSPSTILNAELKLFSGCMRRGINKDPAFAHVEQSLRASEKDFFPTNQKWILRNLTTKQIVRAEAIPPSPSCTRGPHTPGFGVVLMLRTFRATADKQDPANSSNVWAGHRFDITTLLRHVAQTRGEEWSDISDEVNKELEEKQTRLPTYSIAYGLMDF